MFHLKIIVTFVKMEAKERLGWHSSLSQYYNLYVMKLIYMGWHTLAELPEILEFAAIAAGTLLV